MIFCFQLPTSVCSYQDLNYSVVVKEGTKSIMTLGKFTHFGSGVVTHSISSGLTRDRKYSVKLAVITTVGNSTTSNSFSEEYYVRLYPKICNA